jgi:hypothetical protein
MRTTAWTETVAIGLALFAGAVIACSGTIASGSGQYDSCLGTYLGTGCISCVRANCGSELDGLESSCSDMLDCICPGGTFSASTLQSQTCAQKAQESSCQSWSQMNTNFCAQCSGSCNSSGSSSGGVSSSSSGGVSSSSGSGSGGSSGGDLCSDLPSSACQHPPPAPTGTTSMPTTLAHNYAIHQMFLGDTDRSGVTSANAWQTFGYDLDGKITTASSTDVCTLLAGSSKQVQVDGNGGIDNSWGANIMPIMTTLDSTVSQQTNQSLQAGAWTQMTYVVGFDDSAGNTTSAFGLTGVELSGAAYPGAPSWDPSTVWPVAPEYINGCTPTGGCPTGTNPITSAQITFPMAFQSGGTFVSGTPIAMSFPIGIGGQSLVLNIQSAILTFEPQAPGAVTNGVVAGVVATQDIINALQQVAGRISTSLCTGSAFQSIATQIEQTSDIQLSGSIISNTPGAACNAISIGLGFNATEIAAPSVIAPPAPAMPNPCGDGG